MCAQQLARRHEAKLVEKREDTAIVRLKLHVTNADLVFPKKDCTAQHRKSVDALGRARIFLLHHMPR